MQATFNEFKRTTATTSNFDVMSGMHDIGT